MAVGRQLNVKGQMRIDVPHLRLIESGVVYDFDTLAGGILAGKLPYVVTGFIPAAWVGGSAASSISLVTADSIFVNYQASENGSMLMVPSDRAPEQLSITNSRVSGSFTVSQTNYISLDLTRTEDDSTSDVVHFIDPATSQGTPKIIPLGRTMDYQIHITTSPFSTTPQRCPVMIVTTDASNNIVSVVDARPMMFRLAAGGDTPSALSKYAWPEGRNIGVTPANESALFTGGDKAIGDLKSWISAVEEMIWQINAGEYWYSNTQMTSTWFMPSGTNVWGWVLGSQTISWSDPLEIVFTGSTAMHNTIAAGSAVLTANTALYVDFNRYTDGAVLLTYVGPISTLNGEPATPGIRYPIAWRVGTGTPAVRNLPVPAGVSPVGLATTTTPGSVYLNTASATPYAVVSTGLNGSAVAGGLTRSTAGSLQIGTNANDTSISIGNTTTAALVTLYSSSQITLATATTGGTYYIGRFLGFGSTSTINIGSTDVGAYTINIGASSASSGGVYNIGTGLTTGTTNTINIGTGHAGTGHSDIQIGTVSVGSLGLNAALLYLNVSAGACQTTIGNLSAGAILDMFGAPININTTGTGATTIGNATSKAQAGAATAGGDNILTLATKGYVDSAVSGGALAVATTTVAGKVYINTASVTPYAVISTGLGGSAVAAGLQRDSAGALSIGTTANETSISIGNAAGTMGLTASTININASGTGATTIGNATGIATVLGSAVNINVTGTGTTTIGNATSKAAATAATVVGDPALTLVTKGYVEGGGTWQTPVLQDTWTDNGGANSARYCKDAAGVVHIRGTYNNGTGPYPVGYIFNLPNGYRPSTRRIIPIIYELSGYIAFVEITSDGNVVPYWAGTYTAFAAGWFSTVPNKSYYIDISFPTW
jgi:hypothetical protein